MGVPIYLFVALTSLAAELLLAQRHIKLFGGDFRRFHALDTTTEVVAFLACLLSAHLLLIALLYYALRGVHGPRRRPAFYFSFLFFSLVGFGVTLAAKTRLLSYFSEAISLQTVRALGGGSLVQALLYISEEAAPFLLALLCAAAVYALAFRVFRVGRKTDHPGARGPSWLVLLAAAFATILLLLQASRTSDTRSTLDRFIAPALLYAALNEATDFDRDGYSFFSRPSDAQPFDADRHPYALDVPNNGIDEDGLGGDFVYLGRRSAAAPPAFGQDRKHVVLIVLESTRADALTKRWGGRRVAPNMAAMAARGTWSAEAYSHVGYTTASLKSLFTGRLEPLDDRQSLFRDFKRGGYRIGIFSGQAEDFGGIAATTAMRSNSDVFVDAKALEKERIWSSLQDIALIVDGKTLLRELDRHFGREESWRQPNFLYVNIQAAHFPYDFPGALQILPGRPIPRSQILNGDREWIQRTYWNAVAYGDWLVGRIVARLQAVGAYDDSMIIVVGDHGEELFENGYLGHGQVLNRLQTRIPLIFSKPGVAVPRPVGLAGLRPVILRAAGAAIPLPPDEPLLQHIGGLNRPSRIAMVEQGGRRISLDLQTEELIADERGARHHYRALPPGGALKARADRLVHLWERERWLQRRPQQ